MSRALASASSQYLLRAGSPITAVPLSISAWVKLASAPTGGNLMSIVSLQNNTGNNFFDLGLYNDAGTVRVHTYCFKDGSNFTDRGIAFTPVNGTWFHAGSVMTSTTAIQAFYNGTGDDGTYGTQTGTAVPVGINEVTIGAIDYNNGTPIDWFLNGSVERVAVWNVALTVAEMAKLAGGLAPQFIRPANLVLCPPLYGDTSPEPDLASATSWTVSGATKGSNSPMIYAPPAFTFKRQAARRAATY